MITDEGIKIDPSIESLQDGDGFTVKVKTSWRVNKNKSNQEAISDANSQGLLGLILNGHEDTKADAVSKVCSTIDTFWTDINNLIDNHNSNS